MVTRREKILRLITPQSGNGLEIGPLCWPVVTKGDGRVWYADHASAAELQKIYKDDPGVPKDRIVPIDFVLAGRSLHATVGKKRFNYVIASHVIEHVPDMVGWLRDIANILRPDGVVSLVIPDKRFTFDIDRNVSRPSDIIGAYLDKHSRPDAATIFDYAANYRDHIDPAKIIHGELYLTDKHATHRYTAAAALAQCEANQAGTYIDAHVHVFTPASFFAVLRELIALDLFDFTVASFFDTVPGEYEFFVTLRKKGADADKTAQLRSVPPLPPSPPVRALEARAKQLDEKLSALEAEIKSLHSQLRTHEAEIQTLHTKLSEQAAAHAAEMHALLGSHSWRITKPLRKIGEAVQRIKRP